MSPLFEYHCTECLIIFEALAKFDEEVPCPKCTCIAVKRPTAAGGYTVAGGNSASTRPKHAGSFKK